MLLPVFLLLWSPYGSSRLHGPKKDGKYSHQFHSHFEQYEFADSFLSFQKSQSESTWSLHCMLDKIAIEEGDGYEFSLGYRPSDSMNSDINEFGLQVRNLSTYGCDNIESTLAVQLSRNNKNIFNVTKFLATMQDRSLSIIGDSLGNQLFNSLDAELFPYVSWSSPLTTDSNGTHSFFEYFGGAPLWEPPPIHRAVLRHYDQSNFTLMYCQDGLLLPDIRREVITFCVRQALNRVKENGVLILVVGAWYKPYDTGNYRSNLKSSLESYMQDLLSFRRYASEIISQNTQVIWRLNSHMGPIDEYHSLGYRNYSHDNGSFWDSHPKEALWVSKFNLALKAIARTYGDYVLDHHSISRKMLHFVKRLNFTTMPQIHADSLHFCAGGLFRAGNLLLQDLVRHSLHC